MDLVGIKVVHKAYGAGTVTFQDEKYIEVRFQDTIKRFTYLTKDSDLNDADGKLGKVTASTVASIGGSWAGAFGGAKLGALAGTLAGPAAPHAIPILGIIGGVFGSLGGEAAAEWIVDITCLEE